MNYTPLTREQDDALIWTLFYQDLQDAQFDFLKTMLPYITRLVEGWPMGETKEQELHNELQEKLPALVEAHKKHRAKIEEMYKNLTK